MTQLIWLIKNDCIIYLWLYNKRSWLWGQTSSPPPRYGVDVMKSRAPHVAPASQWGQAIHENYLTACFIFSDYHERNKDRHDRRAKKMLMV